MKPLEEGYLRAPALKKFIEEDRLLFYKGLPYYIENHTLYKVVPYIYSKDLLNLIEQALKSLRELSYQFTYPYEEKAKSYDYALNTSPLTDLERNMIKKICYYDNLLNKRCFERWLLSDGRPLIKTLREVFIKIGKEFGNTSPILKLFVATLIKVFFEKKSDFITLELGKVTQERKDVYFSNLFFFLIKHVVDSVVLAIKDEGLYDIVRLKFLSPLVLYENKKVFLRNPFNYWHLTKGLFETLEKNQAFFQEDMSSLSSRDVYSEALFCEKTRLLREHIFNFFSSNYMEDDFMVKLTTIYYTPSLFFNFFKESSLREELYKLKRTSKLLQFKDGREKLALFQDGIERIVGLSERDMKEGIYKAIKGYFVYKNHELYADYLLNVIENIKNLRKDQSYDLKREYESGKLYYFSTESSPVLKGQEEEYSSTVFIDIREFSKKTFHLKEEAVLELLKERFYLPLLRYAGSRKEVGNIKLGNIVGDAIIFIGPVEELVKLSIFAKKKLNEYKHGLEHIVEDKEKKELLALDTGIFITYGKAPILTSMSSEFGTHIFSIGDIINEASRGARRDGEAFKRISYLIEAESKKRGVKIKLPFDVVIIEGYEINIPPTIEAKLVELGNEKEVAETIGFFFDQAKTDLMLMRERGESPWTKKKFIYNIGIGITKKALTAFVKSQKIYSEIREFSLSVDRLPQDIKKQFYFRDRTIELLTIKNRSSGEKFLFRKEGTIQFKGFYEEVEIWEILTEDHEIYPYLLASLE